MGAGFSGAMSSFDGSWGGFTKSVLTGGAIGIAIAGAGRILAPVGATLAATRLGVGVTSLAESGAGWLGNTALGSSAAAAFTGARNWLGVQAEATWGNSLVSRVTGSAMRTHMYEALAGPGVPGGGVPAADARLMTALHEQTMAVLDANGPAATSWETFRSNYWKAARTTPAFNQLFPNGSAGTGAPTYGNLDRLNIHHLAGRIRDLVFAESNLSLVPNALDTPFVHSSAYLTGTQQALIRRGLRSLFPRQWTSGMAAGLAHALPGVGGGPDAAAC